MDRINAIYRHPLYQEKAGIIRQEETARIYCRHGLDHALDTARLMYIRALEEKADLPKDLIYAAALLHDIGRADQYTEGTPHDEAGVSAARIILSDCGFEEEERELIEYAVSGHRVRDGQKKGSLRERFAGLLSEADHRSRLCFCCDASDTCKWPEEKKNREIVI